MKYRYEVYRLPTDSTNISIDDLKGTAYDYTNYFVMPFFYNGNLNQTLNVGEVMLDCAPISTKHDFPPKTKIVVRRYDNQDNLVEYDLIVDNDYCEEYVGVLENGERSLCSHKISCISPAAVAQGMHCDNMALTYKLQDVTLNYRVNVEMGTVDKIDNVESGANSSLSVMDKIVVPSASNNDVGGSGMNSSWYNKTFSFNNNFKYVWEDLAGLENLNKNSYGNEEVSFLNPKLVIKWGNNFQYSAQLNSKTEIFRIKKNAQGDVLENTKIKEVVNGPTVPWSDVGDNPQIDGALYYQVVSQGDNPIYALYFRRIENNVYDDANVVVVAKKFDEMPNITNNPYIALTILEADNNVEFEKTSLTNIEMDEGLFYEYKIKCSIIPFELNNYLENVSTICFSEYTYEISSSGLVQRETLKQTTETFITVSPIIGVEVSITSGKISTESGGDVLLSGNKYNAFLFFQKAMQTTDTYFLDDNETLESLYNKYPIVLASIWLERMQKTTMFETILETKNLWEVFQQIGKYLHAEPDLRFHRNRENSLTGKFELFFKELGVKTESNKKSQPLSIFNNQSIKQYYNSYDSYVSNLFSPENIVTEVITPTSMDGSHIVQNDNAVFKFKYNVYEFIEIKIRYLSNDNNLDNKWIDLKDKGIIFEKSIFNILTIKPNIAPSKANSLYWSIGGDTIENLNYTPPKDAVYTAPLTALKSIIGRLYGLISSASKDLIYSNIQLFVKYRTQDSVRFSQFRPDMYDFVKNSPFEKYPHHEQFYNQLDKIPDSERFSTNMWGQLIKNGNNIYTCNEFFIPDSNNYTEKKEGDMFVIDGKPYYVTASENEYYNNCILQKITYSANWNEIAEITSINSEPRVYEVSERSMVRREVRLNDFIVLTTKEVNRPLNVNSTKFLPNWASFIRNLVFNENSITLPNYARTTYSNDYNSGRLFPSSELNIVLPNFARPVESSDSSKNIVPVLNFPKKDGILFEWDMDDNFQAGEYFYEGDYDKATEDAYYIAQPVRYCDVSGKADRFKFNLFYLAPENISIEDSRTLILAKDNIDTSNSVASSIRDIALNKDNREALSFNYQINLIYDDFITFNSLFARKLAKDSNGNPKKLSLMLYQGAIGLFDPFTDFTGDKVVEILDYTFTQNGNNELRININKPALVDDKPYSLIWYETDPNDSNNHIIYIAKNLTEEEKGDTQLTYYMYPTYNENEQA